MVGARGRPTAPTGSTARKTRAEIFSIDTPPPTVSGSLHMGSVFGYVQTDAIARYQRMRGRRGLLPDGLGRQRPAHRAPGAELLRRALRPVAARTTPTSSPPEKPAKHAIPISRPNFVELCDTPRRRGRAGVRGAVAPARPLGRLGDDLHDDRRGGAAGVASARSCATSPAARRTRPRRRRCGTSTSAPRSRRPSSKTARCPGAYHAVQFHAGRRRRRHRDRDHPARAAPRVRRARRASRRRALPAAASAPRSLTPLFGVPVPVRRAPARRSREGLGHRDDLHVRRHHRRRVVARAAAARRARSSGRDGRLLAEPPELGGEVWPTTRATRYARARGQDGEAGADSASSSCSTSPASSSASRSRSRTR